MKRRLFLSILVMITVLSFFTYGCNENEPERASAYTVTSIDKYGNITLDLKSEVLLSQGHKLGDVFVVTVDGNKIYAPIIVSYSNVTEGRIGVMCREDKEFVIIAVNGGEFTEKYGISQGDGIGLEYAGKDAVIPQDEDELIRTNKREDYESDEAFANFRCVTAGSMGKNKFFRSSSPVNNKYGRNTYADELAEKNGIKSIINLANSKDELENYGSFGESYYKTVADANGIICLNADIKFESEGFKSKLVKGLRFLADAQTPVLVHCTEGKDRAGYFSLIVECLMGASLDEVTDDYMQSFVNYYHIEKGSEIYNKIAEEGVYTMLYGITSTENLSELKSVKLTQKTEEYLKSIGITDNEIQKIRNNLGN